MGPIFVIVISLIRGVSLYLSTIITNEAALKSTTKLQTDFFEKLLTLDYSALLKEQSGAFTARFLNDIHVIRDGVLKVANSFVRDLLTIIGLIWVMFSTDWQLALVSFTIIPIAIYPVNLIGKKLRKNNGCCPRTSK